MTVLTIAAPSTAGTRHDTSTAGGSGRDEGGVWIRDRIRAAGDF